MLGLTGLGILVPKVLPRHLEIGKYVTSLEGRTPNQRFNAILSAGEVDHQVIAPGATWSFNQTVKGWTARDGYRKAPVSYNGQLVDAWGGGVCQTASTVYNAALLAGFKIEQRHRHQFAPSYVPPGRDAAVAYENIDLQFTNTWPQPVTLRARVQGERLVVSFETLGGEAPSIKVTEEVLHVQRPSTNLVQGKSTTRVKNSGKPGYHVRVWRVVGAERQLISENHYPVMDRIVEVP